MSYKEKSKELGPLTEDELRLDFDDKIFREILIACSFSKNPIALFDHWVEFILPKQITTRHQILEKGENVFSDVKVASPTMFPKEAREQKETYSGMITATITFNPKAGAIGVTSHTKKGCELGKIPIMVGSILCRLYGMSDEERIKHGECFNDHFGYFIIKGAEKIIIIQEQLAFSQPITYIGKSGKFETRFTSHTDTGTSLMTIILGEKWQSLKIKLFSSLGKHIPLFVMYEILLKSQYANPSREDIIQYALNEIFQFVKEEDRERVKFALYPSIAKLQTIPDSENASIDYMLGKRIKIINKKIEAAKKRKKNINIEAMKDSKERIIREINNDLFPNVHKEQKTVHLSMVVAQMVLCMVNLRKADNRDGWENKSLQAPANALEQLFNGIWTNFIEGETKDNTFNIPTANISDGFVSAFAPNGWGAKGSNRKENIVVALIRESVISVFSQILKCNTPTSRQLRDSKVRQISGSQNGYLCLPETPEGTNCGLTKNLASSCWISLHRNYEKFIDLLQVVCNPLDTYISGVKSDNFPYPLTVNGIIQGWCNTNSINNIIPQLKIIKRKKDFFDICIYFNTVDNKMEVYIDGCRPCRPLYVTDPITQTLIIDQLENKETKTVMELIEAGAIEFIHAREQDNLLIAKVPNLVRNFNSDKLKYQGELNEFEIASDKIEQELLVKFNAENDHKLKSEFYDALNNAKSTNQGNRLLLLEKINNPFFTHANIDPTSVLGIAASTMPQANFCQGPRFSYQCSMVKQALGPFHSVKHKRWDTSFKCLLGPSRSLFETQMYEPSGLNALPSGYTPIAAFLIRQNNNEDAIIVKKQFIERFMRIVKYTTHTVTIANSTGGVSEYLAKPVPKEREKEGRYDCIDDKGIPIIGSYIRRNDCIVGKTRKSNQIAENASIYAGVGEEGIVDSVLITKAPNLGIVVRVKIRSVRTQQMGDKVASRYAQKGTFGRVLDEKDMPRIVGGPNDGLVPDYILNTLNIPSRMTLGLLHEIMSSLACLYDPKKQTVDATTFKKFDITYYQNILEANGLNKNAEFNMVNADGTPLGCQVFLGPCYYQALRHHVVDKYQARSHGSIMPETHQPLKGRSNDGGLRFGEMERDALISHGAAYLLSERLMVSSDQYKTEYCTTCGNLINPSINNLPIECKVCKRNGDISKIGVVTMPYIFLLIMRMLLAMGLHTTLKLKDIAKFAENTANQIVE